MTERLLLGHGGWHSIAAAAMSRWTWEPFTIAALVLSAAMYVAGVLALWRRAGRGHGVRYWEAAAFVSGLLTLAIALLSPLAWVSEILFSAHMTQHEMLMLVAAPLLVIGQPLQAMLWVLPAAWREAWARFAGRRATVAMWQALTGPLVVFLLHALALWLWHAPRLYEAALGHDGVHAVQHVSFVLTAALFWWGMVHGRYGRRGYGIAVLYVFLTAIHSSILGALMTIAPRVWYPAYVAAGAQWQVDALVDQQLAGLLMWVPSGVMFIIFGVGLFAAWVGESEKRALLGMVAHKAKHG
jgi:cytochrome c oxidase assembly factor CtaG